MTAKRLLIVAAVVLLAAAPAAAVHRDGRCTPTRADPSTTWLLPTPDGRLFYLEERGNPLATSPPVPGSGFLLGGGTWFYEEANGVEAPDGSMQRGSVGFVSQCFPPPPFPCLLLDEDPIYDESCGHGPDIIIF